MSRLLKLFSLSLILAVVTTVLCQDEIYFSSKPGSCPPALPVQMCSRTCAMDEHCEGSGKCCPTSCGGFVCSRPVTMRHPPSKEHPGSCPAKPIGRWVCTPTCSTDSDCIDEEKCCKNRCGALTCQEPETKKQPIYDDYPYRPNN